VYCTHSTRKQTKSDEEIVFSCFLHYREQEGGSSLSSLLQSELDKKHGCRNESQPEKRKSWNFLIESSPRTELTRYFTARTGSREKEERCTRVCM
jgi:hypothetical protein